MNQAINGTHELLTAEGYSIEATELCWSRYLEFPEKISYDDWCRAYVAVNSIVPTKEAPLDGNVVIKSMLRYASEPQKPKSPKVFRIGSFVKR